VSALCDAHSLCTRVRPASARGSDAIAFSLTSTTFAASPSSQTYSGNAERRAFRSVTMPVFLAVSARFSAPFARL
jgi:hypothetical protein